MTLNDTILQTRAYTIKLIEQSGLTEMYITNVLNVSNKASDHYEGLAADVSCKDRKKIYYFFKYLQKEGKNVKSYTNLEKIGTAVNKFFGHSQDTYSRILLSMHNYHIHISYNPEKRGDKGNLYVGFERINDINVCYATQEYNDTEARLYYGVPLEEESLVSSIGSVIMIAVVAILGILLISRRK